MSETVNCYLHSLVWLL